MENSDFKWRVVISGPPIYGDFYLEPTIAAIGLDSTYLHKPGDIDYSPLSRLPVERKVEILYHVATGCNSDELKSPAIDIAAHILIDQISSPSFVPRVLNPVYW